MIHLNRITAISHRFHHLHDELLTPSEAKIPSDQTFTLLLLLHNIPLIPASPAYEHNRRQAAPHPCFLDPILHHILRRPRSIPIVHRHSL